MYILLYHCGEPDFYIYTYLHDLKKDFPNFKKDKYVIGVYKIDKILFER